MDEGSWFFSAEGFSSAEVVELWSDQDEWELGLFLQSVEEADLAGALLALEGIPEETQRGLREQLWEWGCEVRRRCLTQEPGDQLEAMHSLLVDELGFNGDTDDYYAPSNSFLSQVMERRVGMPILLSALWKLVGEAAGLTLAGLGIPGHFVVRIGFEEEGLLVDPFHSGRLLSVAACKRLVEEGLEGRVRWSDHYLSAVTVHSWVTRVLRNLMNCLLLEEDLPRLFRVARFFARLHPTETDVQLTYARLAEMVGALNFAIEAYESISLHSPEAAATRGIPQHLALLYNKVQYLN